MDTKLIVNRIREAELRQQELERQRQAVQDDLDACAQELAAWKFLLPLESKRESNHQASYNAPRPKPVITALYDKNKPLPIHNSQLEALIIVLEQHQEVTMPVIHDEIQQLYGSLNVRVLGIHISMLERAGRITKHDDSITVTGSLQGPYKHLRGRAS